MFFHPAICTPFFLPGQKEPLEAIPAGKEALAACPKGFIDRRGSIGRIRAVSFFWDI
jgi:hypothetical protein